MGNEQIKISELMMRQFGEQMVKFSEEVSDMAMKANRVGKRMVEISEKLERTSTEESTDGKKSDDHEIDVPGESGNTAVVNQSP